MQLKYPSAKIHMSSDSPPDEMCSSSDIGTPPSSLPSPLLLLFPPLLPLLYRIYPDLPDFHFIGDVRMCVCAVISITTVAPVSRKEMNALDAPAAPAAEAEGSASVTVPRGVQEEQLHRSLSFFVYSKGVQKSKEKKPANEFKVRPFPVFDLPCPLLITE